MNTRLIKTNNIFDLFDQALLNEDYSFWRRPLSTTTTNAISWKDLGEAFEMQIPLPGFKKEHLSAEVDDGQVSLKAEREDDSAQYSFYLPEGADPTNISAKLEDGLLNLVAEKLEKSKKIQLKIS